MKTPTPGQVVLFHFLGRAPTGSPADQRTRPAIVVDADADSGYASLYVMWWPGDRPATWAQPTLLGDYGLSLTSPSVGDVPPATEGTFDRTWTFRTEDL